MEAKADYSLTPFASLDNSKPGGSFWKTCQRYFCEDLQTYSEPWPKAGLMFDGRCYLPPLSARRICEDDFSYYVSWPTPRAAEWKGTGPLGSKSHKWRLSKNYLDAKVQEVEQATGRLNPEWLEWLQGFPVGWTDTNGKTE